MMMAVLLRNHTGSESLISDLSSPPYTRKTSSSERYTILACRSLGHNVPLVNGCEQQPGEEYKARLMEKSFTDTEDKIVFELKGLYLEEAGLEYLRREAIINKEGKGYDKINDEYSFKDEKTCSFIEHFYSFKPDASR